uniref:Uncharacterized protein n=1 Tax=Anguilla anguilla TaxID=7936 RepID=A0A0E9UCG3_ANGAN
MVSETIRTVYANVKIQFHRHYVEAWDSSKIDIICLKASFFRYTPLLCGLGIYYSPKQL